MMTEQRHRTLKDSGCHLKSVSLSFFSCESSKVCFGGGVGGDCRVYIKM